MVSASELVGGSWGFATSTMILDGVGRGARGRDSPGPPALRRSVHRAAPTPAVKGTWKTPITRDPLMPIEEKVAPCSQRTKPRSRCRRFAS
jgi:hypothetical protein